MRQLVVEHFTRAFSVPFFLSLIRHQCLLQYSLAQAEIIKIRKQHNRLGMYSRVPE